MALKDNILKDFFEKTKKPLETSHSVNKPYHRVFDDPMADIERVGSIPLNISETNWSQTRDKLESELETNKRQTRDKLETNLISREIKKPETRVRTRDKTRDNSETNRSQTRDKLETNQSQIDKKIISNINMGKLTGLQREIPLLLFKECQKIRAKISPPLSTEYLGKMLKSNVLSIKKAIQRLEKKGVLRRSEWKEGRGGWTRYELEDCIYNDILHDERNLKLESNWSQTRDNSETNWSQTRDKLESELESELETSFSSSSSNYINTTTTELRDEWKKINISPLESIGFTAGHLIQLQRAGITSAEFVQDSIDHFFYDLTNNNKGKEIKTNPIGYFMGIMKRAGIYTAPDNYESEKDRSLRIYLENKKQQKERQATMEAELIDLSYNEWISEITEEEKKIFIPESILNGNIEGAKISALKAYFRKNVWPEKSKIIFLKQVQ